MSPYTISAIIGCIIVFLFICFSVYFSVGGFNKKKVIAYLYFDGYNKPSFKGKSFYTKEQIKKYLRRDMFFGDYEIYLYFIKKDGEVFKFKLSNNKNIVFYYLEGLDYK